MQIKETSKLIEIAEAYNIVIIQIPSCNHVPSKVSFYFFFKKQPFK